MSFEVPYATSAVILDCMKPGAGYSPASYPDKGSCNSLYGDCDNRSYSAYALPSAYNGYYDECFKGKNNSKACDLKYVNASPSTVLGCWGKCCTNSPMGLTNCNQTCQTNCVVTGGISPPVPLSNKKIF